MPIEIKSQTYYTSSEVSVMIGISRGSLIRWIKSGTIEDAKIRNRNGWRLFSEAEIKKIKAEAQKTRDNK